MRPFHRGRGRGNFRHPARGSQWRGSRSRTFKPRGFFRGGYRPGGNEHSGEYSRGHWDDHNDRSEKDTCSYLRYSENGHHYKQKYSKSDYDKFDEHHHKSRRDSNSYEHYDRDMYHPDDLDREYDKYYGEHSDNEEWGEWEEYEYDDQDWQDDKYERDQHRQDDWGDKHETERSYYKDRRYSYENKYQGSKDNDHHSYNGSRKSKDRGWGKEDYHYDKHKSTQNWESKKPHSESNNHTAYTENENKSQVDWETNESGIKMAIEYLKSKPTMDKEKNIPTNENSQEVNFPEVKPETLEKEAIEDLVSDLLNLILNNGGEMTISNLGKEFTKSVNHQFKNDALKSFLSKYPTVFELLQSCKGKLSETEATSAGNEVVRAKTGVRLCEVHCTRPKTCPGECNALHICKFYILSSCEIIKCKFGHNLTDDHNIEVQQKFFLHRVELKNLCFLLQQESNRSSVTVPVICRYYNSLGGCWSDEKVENPKSQFKCPFVHLCQKYVEGNCKVWSSCRRNHSLTHGSTYQVLCKHGLDPRCLVDGTNRVLALLKWSLNDFKEKVLSKSPECKKGEVDKNTDKPEDTKQRLKRKVQVTGDDDVSVKIQKVFENKEVTQANSLLNDTSLAAEELLAATTTTEIPGTENGNVPKETMETKIDHDLPENNKNIECHNPSWSFEDNNGWKDMPMSSLSEIEKKYQQYLAARVQTVLLDGKYFTVDFGKLEGSYSGSSGTVKVRRKMVSESSCGVQEQSKE